MNIFEKINNLDILKVLEIAWISYKKDSWQMHTYTIYKSDGKLDNSLKVNTSKNIAIDFWWNGDKWWPFDFIWRYLLNQDTQTDIWKATTIKWFIEKWLVEPEEWKKKFVKTLKWEELLQKFEQFKLWGYKSEISSFLMLRGVPYDYIQKNHLKIWEIFSDVWFYDNYFCTEHETIQDEEWKWHTQEWDNARRVEVFMFPQYDENKKLIGIKLRRKDGKTIRGKKSYAIWKTWLWFKKIHKDKGYITEWEIDAIILRILWYDSVVANGWGVQSNKDRIRSVLYNTDRIICLYDNDWPWITWKQALAEVMWRIIFDIEYPIREDIRGRKLSDVNDFYKAWYDSKRKWDELFLELRKVWEREWQNEDKYPFVFLRRHMEYYDVEEKKIQNTDSIAKYLGLTWKELYQLVSTQVIQTYRDLCYYEWGREWYYNTLDESTIIKHWWKEKPELHPHIKTLINNICNHKKRNVEWIHRAILYKLTHINDVNLPALILYGAWWSGKGTFLNLLSKIFWQENTQIWLTQKDLESQFDSYTWNKLIVEFKEVSSGNKHNDKKILDKIKSFVWEKRITVNSKFQNAKEVDNIAWFHMSSNHPVPIQLDSKHSGNRRFTIIKTGTQLNTKLAEEINNFTLQNESVIKQYVAWLYEEYPDVLKLTTFEALNNAEKKALEDNCEWVWNLFFEWFEKKYPHIQKITNVEKNILLDQYRVEMWEDEYWDSRYKTANFDAWLSHRYEKKLVKIRGKALRWYFINKTDFEIQNMPYGKEPFFAKNQIEKPNTF